MNNNITSIDNLPNSNINNNNIVQQPNMQQVLNIPQQETQLPSNAIDQPNNNQNINMNDYNEMISQLQNVNNNSISLPSRDIPINPTQVSNDVQVDNNYIPPPANNIDTNYINNLETPDNLIVKEQQLNDYYNSLENIYSELQLPLVIILIYFLFQLPFFKLNSFKFLPLFHNKDGNYNLKGNVFISILFGISFYSFQKILLILNK
tara:strand:+ start:12913 stop:13530 length:618 start_codon:yes stop_codon:yes gene_type:complete